MLEYINGHYAYWFTFILLMIGLYGMIMKKNLVKKLIGMTIFQVSVIIFYINCTAKWGTDKLGNDWNATVPILKNPPHDAEALSKLVVDTTQYINPLPHTLMLTAIVVGVATTGVAFALVISIYQRYKTLNEEELLERMKKDND
ncbi:MAG: cation:proton antiporter subunit C [bacterium]|nr:cation:proton antiporter subunit C [bacterium]